PRGQPPRRDRVLQGQLGVLVDDRAGRHQVPRDLVGDVPGQCYQLRADLLVKVGRDYVFGEIRGLEHRLTVLVPLIGSVPAFRTGPLVAATATVAATVSAALGPVTPVTAAGAATTVVTVEGPALAATLATLVTTTVTVATTETAALRPVTLGPVT